MKNNSVGTIAVSNTKRPRARFNLSADLHTSMDFGSVIPARVHLQIPNSKVVCSSKERILCSPLLAPTMGRLSLKAYHNFVRLSDLTENFAPMMSQEAVARGTTQFVPQSVPNISLADLSSCVLFGSYLNIYKGSASGVSDDDQDSNVCSSSVYTGTTGDLSSDADLSALGLFAKQSFTAPYPTLTAFGIDPALWLGSTSRNLIPLGNPKNATFYPIDPSSPYFESNHVWYDLSDVTPSNADYVIPVTNSGSVFYLCFRLSDFGKRLRKVLIGCGYQIDFTNTSFVSLLPLCAYFKSYFDVFGLTLYQNWEQTYCYRFLKAEDIRNNPTVSNFWSQAFGSVTYASYLFSFIFTELGLCFYTDEQDFVSAHTASESVSPSPSGVLNVVDVDNLSGNAYTPNIDVASVAAGQNGNSNLDPSTSTNLSGHAFIDSVIHGQLDSELLKRLYRWTNRNTIAGRRIAEILRAQGLGSYVDECKSDFIGSFELPIDIFDGTSNSDTYSQVTDSGAPLGERFGIGQAASGDERNKASCERSFTFECNEFGYWVTLFVIVPKGGYTEALDPSVLALSKFQYYQPDFDSLGMEFDPKSLVVGSMPFADFTAANGSLKDSFGLVPRYFRWKFGRNVANGDFTRRGVRDSFAPYYLDKVIDVGSRLVRDVSVSSAAKIYSIVKEFKPSMLPIAGNVWRYPTRYPFIGRFNRIFNRIFGSREHSANLSAGSFIEFEYFSGTDDNFILHTIFDVQYFAPMLPVEDSFETYDDDNAVNGSMSKA